MSPVITRTVLPAALRCSHRVAENDCSTATTRAAGTSSAIARARAPEPAQRSITIGSARPFSSGRTASTSSSVSGRGMKTPGPTARSRLRNGARPVMCCSGSRAARRVIQLTYSAATESGTWSRVSNWPRGTSSSAASNSSASTRAASIPTAVNRCRRFGQQRPDLSHSCRPAGPRCRRASVHR